MARSWPAFSRASAEEVLEARGLDVHDFLEHFAESRASGGSMMADGIGLGSAGCDAASARVSVEVMVVARCCASSGLPRGVAVRRVGRGGNRQAANTRQRRGLLVFAGAARQLGRRERLRVVGA